MTELQEARLLGRAVKEQWDIPQQERAATVDRVCYLRDYAEKESTQIAAVNAIVAMVGQNQKDQHKFVDAQLQHEYDRLSAIADDLGIDAGAVEAAARQAGSRISTDAVEVDN